MIERDVNVEFTTGGRSSRQSPVVHMNQKRLIGLRIHGNLTQRQLAKSSMVPLRLIKAFEAGEDWPDSEQCFALADALGVDVRRLLDPGDLTFRDFVKRGGGDLSPGQLSEIGIAMVDRLRDHIDVRRILGLPMASWTTPAGLPVPVLDLAEAEAAAELVRSAWSLGNEPIADLAGLLDDHGVIVVEHGLECEAFVAEVERPGAGRFYAIGAKGGQWSLRRRFSLAHELGHLVIDCGRCDLSEKAADRFAGAFLLPAHVVRAAVQEGSVEEVLGLRAHHGVSVQAIALRCVELRMFGDAWKVDVIKRAKAVEQDVGPTRWDEPADLFERRCREALDRGLIGTSRFGELLGLSSSYVGADAA